MGSNTRLMTKPQSLSKIHTTTSYEMNIEVSCKFVQISYSFSQGVGWCAYGCTNSRLCTSSGEPEFLPEWLRPDFDLGVEKRTLYYLESLDSTD